MYGAHAFTFPYTLVDRFSQVLNLEWMYMDASCTTVQDVSLYEELTHNFQRASTKTVVKLSTNGRV